MYYLWLVAPWESSIHKQAHVHIQNGYGYMCIFFHIDPKPSLCETTFEKWS